jgi:hypothetical protein
LTRRIFRFSHKIAFLIQGKDQVKYKRGGYGQDV